MIGQYLLNTNEKCYYSYFAKKKLKLNKTLVYWVEREKNLAYII